MKNLKIKIYAQILKNGNMHSCEKLILKTLKLLQLNNNKNYKSVIKSAIIHTTPILEIRQIKKKKRKGLKEFPYILNKQNRIALGIKLLKLSSKIKFSKYFFQNIMLFSKKKNRCFKKKRTSSKRLCNKEKVCFF